MSRPLIAFTFVAASAILFGASSSSSAKGEGYLPTGDAPYPARAILSEPAAKATGFWAHTRYAAKVRRLPSVNSRKVATLRFLTEDKFPETYAVYRSKMVDDVLWYRIGIPARPNGQRGWVREEALGKVYAAYRVLRISRKHYTAKLWENRPSGGPKLIWKARVGVGAPGTETPGGLFWIRERIKGFQSGTVYGYMAFGTSAYSKLSDWPGGGVVGIHGTNEPDLIPGEISHGCIRVRNHKIYKLSKLLFVGTPVRFF